MKLKQIREHVQIYSVTNTTTPLTAKHDEMLILNSIQVILKMHYLVTSEFYSALWQSTFILCKNITVS